MALALAFVILTGALIWFDAAGCAAKTRDIGMERRWSALSGCLVRDAKSGAWLPLANYRHID